MEGKSRKALGGDCLLMFLLACSMYTFSATSGPLGYIVVKSMERKYPRRMTETSLTGRGMSYSDLSPELDRNKTLMEKELLIKLGVKKEEFVWHPDIIYRKTERPASHIHIEYPVDTKLGRPKYNMTVQNRNPWSCSNQALRQMTMISRQGPRILYFNKKQSVANTVNILRIDKSSF